jgi:hypothetical protein
LPAPVSDLKLTVAVAGFGVAVSNDLTPNNPSTIQVVIPAGQRISKPFFVMGTNTGTATLVVSGGGFNSSNSNVTIVQSTLVFQEAAQAQPIGVSVGGSTTLTVVPALLPLGTPSPAGLALRGGAQPISVGLTVGATAAFGITPGTVTLQPGDQKATVTVLGLAAGSGTVALNALSAYQVPNAQSTVKIAVTAAH